jgi:hypothetical protein
MMAEAEWGLGTLLQGGPVCEIELEHEHFQQLAIALRIHLAQESYLEDGAQAEAAGG